MASFLIKLAMRPFTNKLISEKMSSIIGEISNMREMNFHVFVKCVEIFLNV